MISNMKYFQMESNPPSLVTPTSKTNSYNNKLHQSTKGLSLQGGSGSHDHIKDITNKTDQDVNRQVNDMEGDESTHPLFIHGMCRWTSCELGGFKTIESFREHLSRDHILDERSTAQTRVQVCLLKINLRHTFYDFFLSRYLRVDSFDMFSLVRYR